MSIVGTRPPLISETNLYEPHHKAKKAAQDDADVQAAVKKVTEELGDTGRILVRESGTEPVVRVMVEAESEEVCQKYVDMVVGVISEKGYVVE